MRGSLPEVRSLARALLEGQRASTGADAPVEATERVLQRLAGQITPLVGAGGFGMLLQRALRRARGEHPWLGAVQIDPQAPWRLPGMAEVAPEEAAAAAQAFVTELIGLVARFLGADLAIRLVRQSFPEVPRGGDMGSDAEETTNER